ncbi:MAG: ATP-binding protein [Bacteroidales bacterium]|nr:ATP-binding protein [Bacteroidales bacterium]
MKDIKAIRGRAYILDLIAEGEHVRQDFKFAISDARKIARSISAFANREGGALLVGVKDNGTIAGVRNEEDIFMIEQAAEMYCSPPQQVEFQAYKTGETGIVIRAVVAKADCRPVMVKEADKTMKAYYRVADENIVAHPLMVRAWERRAQEIAESFSLDGVESQLLKLLNECESVRADDLILRIAASRRTVENAIVRLAALGLVDFIHQSDAWMLRIADVEGD